MNKIDNLNNKKLDVSSLAIEQMGKILSLKSFIRISVDSGGCSGFSIIFQLIAIIKENDIELIKQKIF